MDKPIYSCNSCAEVFEYEDKDQAVFNTLRVCHRINCHLYGVLQIPREIMNTITFGKDYKEKGFR